DLLGRHGAAWHLVVGGEAAVGAHRDALVRQVQRREEVDRATEAPHRGFVREPSQLLEPVAGRVRQQSREIGKGASRTAQRALDVEGRGVVDVGAQAVEVGGEDVVGGGERHDKKPVKGDDASATRATVGRPARKPPRPASTASLNAVPIATGSPAVPMAVLTSTASAPSSMASAACEGAPIPASTTTGTSDCSTMISRAARVRSPWFEPIHDPSGMTVAQPASSRCLHRIGPALT